MAKLRPWQKDCLDKAISWFNDGDRDFLINAAPGAGKTIASCVIAQELFVRDEIDRVIVIAPRNEVVNQWATDFRQITGRFLGRVTGKDVDIAELDMDLCATWAAVQGLQDGFQAVCNSSRTLVICDEHHHAAIEATWGDSAENAFASAKHTIVLSGTPIRSDGEQAVWLAYDNQGIIDHPEQGTYTLTYGEAVDLGYCRPVTFHRHEGQFSVELDDGQSIEVSGGKPAELTQDLKRVPGLQRALDFYQLACKPLYEKDDRTPLVTGYQGTMVNWAIEKLDDLRLRMPEAGGLVIVPTIDMARYMVDLITLIDGEVPMLVHSQMPNPEQKIRAFRNNNKRWLVSVAMVSEGVDIKRLRVLIYLPKAQTELTFRQAIGRVVRTMGRDDDTRAYVVMPDFETFNIFARRVEDEMPPGQRKEPGRASFKRCPVCEHECPLGATECESCGHDFPERTPFFKPCGKCGGLNPMAAKSCQHCGESFESAFNLSLQQALRQGAIVRGMDIDEHEVLEAEQIATKVRTRIIQTGDEKLIGIIKALPDESWGRLRQILED
jgi:superfamily II DNA or RNA helicase